VTVCMSGWGGVGWGMVRALFNELVGGRSMR